MSQGRNKITENYGTDISCHLEFYLIYWKSLLKTLFKICINVDICLLSQLWSRDGKYKQHVLIKLFLTFFPFRVKLLWIAFQLILTIIFPTLSSSVLIRRFRNVTFLERALYFSLWDYLPTYWHPPYKFWYRYYQKVSTEDFLISSCM